MFPSASSYHEDALAKEIFQVDGLPILFLAGFQIEYSHGLLVFEMAFAGEEHGDAEFVAFLDRVLVAD